MSERQAHRRGALSDAGRALTSNSTLQASHDRDADRMGRATKDEKERKQVQTSMAPIAEVEITALKTQDLDEQGHSSHSKHEFTSSGLQHWGQESVGSLTKAIGLGMAHPGATMEGSESWRGDATEGAQVRMPARGHGGNIDAAGGTRSPKQAPSPRKKETSE